MAQNITLLGASYTAVPAVTLPKTGGGTAKFSDASVTTAVASDVAEGKIFLLADGTQATGTASGGGGGSTRTTIVPEQTANYTERYNQINFIAPLVIGEVYIYTIDGVESQSTAFDNYGTVGLGSPDTTIGFDYGNGVMYLSIADTSLRTTHTIKIEQESEGGGGSATLITKTITANGTYSAEDDDADGYSEVTVNVAGGASNIVTGTFKGTTTGAAMDVDLAYTGNGYPVAVVIYPKEGAYNASSGTIYSLVQRYATLWYAAYKDYADSAASYDGTGDENNYTVAVRYKNNVSSATTYANYVSASMPISNDVNASNPSGTPKFTVRLKSKTKMSVFIAASSYGFAANVEYTYQVIYSS